jgi:hypothetical protein
MTPALIQLTWLASASVSDLHPRFAQALQLPQPAQTKYQFKPSKPLQATRKSWDTLNAKSWCSSGRQPFCKTELK